MSDQGAVSDFPRPAAGGVRILRYRRPTDARSSPWREVLLLAMPFVLTVTTFGIAAQAAHDSDPFAPTLFQSSLYLGLGSAVMLSWVAWTLFLTLRLVRRRLHWAWTLGLLAGLVWGGLLSAGLYQNTAEYIDQTTRFHGASWPVVDQIFRP